ncbi:MAG: Glycerol-3-phosphate acyltransferase [Elusimicrobia bacterium ADurb.Bin231]|nr:MAG: Glycerol-3-phosphate acyltransferase [Elusimicrobia bacterium ADurb.Bin231]
MLIAVILFSFLIGSFPTAYLITKIFYGKDIRKLGSGNPGATNVFRCVSKIVGIITFVIDAGKGFIPVFVASRLFPAEYPYIPILCGSLSVAGHMWTPFLGFKGGKGVATGAGVFLGLYPVATVLSMAVFMTVLFIFKYVSIGSIVASFSMPIFLAIFGESLPIIVISFCLAMVILWKHKSNIEKIIEKKRKKI